MQPSAEIRFREVYECHAAAVRAYVRRRIALDLVDDVVAETFLVCWRKLDRVPEEPLPWLYAVARKALANQYRTSARQAADPAARPSEPFPEVEGDPVLARAFGLLSEGDREVLRLVAWEELSLPAAARALGCSQVACRVRLHRAKRRLAAHLDRLGRAAAGPTCPAQPKGATQ